MSDDLQYPTKCTRVMPGHDGVILKVIWNGTFPHLVANSLQLTEITVSLLVGYDIACDDVNITQDTTVRLWNPHRGLLVKTYRGHGRDVYDVAVEHDNTRFVSCGGDRLVFQWDVGTGRVIRRFRGHTHRVNTCALKPDGTILVTGSYDATVKVWDLKQRGIEPVDVLKESKDSISCVMVDGTDIIAGSVDGCVRIYDIRKGEVRSDHYAAPVSSVSLSNDGKCFLVSTMDEKIRLMDRGTGDCLATYTGHTNKQYRLDACLSNSDAHVLSASEDGTVIVWDLVDANIVARLRDGDMGAVTSVAYHTDETCCLSSGFDGVVRLWT